MRQLHARLPIRLKRKFINITYHGSNGKLKRVKLYQDVIIIKQRKTRSEIREDYTGETQDTHQRPSKRRRQQTNTINNNNNNGTE